MCVFEQRSHCLVIPISLPMPEMKGFVCTVEFFMLDIRNMKDLPNSGTKQK